MEELEKKFRNEDIINKIYKTQEEVIDQIIKKANKDMKGELKSIDTEKVIGEARNPEELKKIFEKIEDNYNVKITNYNREIYKQGFKDGMNLILNCLK